PCSTWCPTPSSSSPADDPTDAVPLGRPRRSRRVDGPLCDRRTSRPERLPLGHPRHQPHRGLPPRLLTVAAGRVSTEVTTPVAVGVLGGFTTFSTFAWEAFEHGRRGRAGLA